MQFKLAVNKKHVIIILVMFMKIINLIGSILLYLFILICISIFKINNWFYKSLIYFILIVILVIINKIKFNSIKFKFTDIIHSIFISIIFTITIIFITNIINNYYKLPINQNNILLEFNNNKLFTISKLLVFIPIIEEIIFRYNFKYINNKYLYIIISSSIFSLMHLTGTNEAIYFIPYFLLGFMLSFIYVKYNNLLYCITCHLLYNLIILLTII